ncbi:PTS transporter subunit IIABC [Mobilicoccus caccae]|uniref:PTS glucose transporter subunit IIA n=1 Tax=Mobilicoccus caccae TaxID=1859295 RepID=A0ABQ6IW14_9MICO|nr:PTS transporter subunit IIABC [Mobilicoccus caccae]GMA42143.1 hypothetical protein GCM10025883_41880 [Mobilicoccus caccae]
MKDQIFATLQRVGRAFMLPIAILPVAGLFLGIGGSFTNETMLTNFGLMEAMGPGTIPNDILQVMNAAGGIIFGNLPIIFAIAVALAMARQNKAVAALSGAIAFFVMHASIGAMLAIRYPGDARTQCETAQAAGQNPAECLPSGSFANVVGIDSLQMGVFGGIIVGLGVAALHNRYHNIKLPEVLSFFGGERFVPIISSIVFLVVGIAMAFAWPVVQIGINALGALVLGSGYAGTFIYGIIERALIPFGLHHVFYLPFWQTSVGGVMEVCGQQVQGAQNIFFAQLGCADTTAFSSEATRFMAGKFPFMIFGLPGAALAMYQMASPAKRKVAGSLLLSAALTAILTGITEPLEFTFLFVAPLLYIIHCLLAGLSFMLMHLLNVGVGMTFSGGLIDLTLFGILQGNDRTNWLMIPLVGIVYFFVYYLLFRVLISKLNLKTPGRDDTDEVKLYSRSDVDAKTGRNTSHGSSSAAGGGGTATATKTRTDVDEDTLLAAAVVKGLGGLDNLTDVDNCITRLRVSVKDGSLVDDSLLKSTGASGVMKSGKGVQVIYGPRVTAVATAVHSYMENPVDVDVDDEDVAEIEAAAPGGATAAGAGAAAGAATADAAPARVATIVRSPLAGEVIELSEVEDAAFGGGLVGPGVGIRPTSNTVVAPCDATVALIFPTKHAVGLKTDSGVELLIHIGLDTVKLDGVPFEAHVETGQIVEEGTPLVTFDPEAIEAAGYKLTTPVIVTNSAAVGQPIIVASTQVQAGDGLFVIR